MENTELKFNYLKDFRELEYSTPELFATFILGKEKTTVKAEYKIIKNAGVSKLFLNGVDIKFLSARINGVLLLKDQYKLLKEGIVFLVDPNLTQLSLTVENENYPNKNTELEGLYLSGDLLCTQNEPMGFRKIMYSLDRPDNMVQCRVKILGDKRTYPVMLANGNLIEEGFESGLYYCIWEDPFPKSLHLFALVAGDLAKLTSEYTTKSGRKIDLKFYFNHGAENKCDFAIKSLKNAMRWDEERFNLEYDLDLYMVAAVDSFNMGAMENKGLNIFNSALVLVDPATATDLNYHRVESVIGHEYFHNWTGNRVTLKNWFQLTLKEGLTVFRDQEFSADLNDAAVERIDMVKSLKERQFSEDSGPLAHPIRPEKYQAMNNFYTPTVYEKGAEVIRMLFILLGEEKFQKGMTEYFKEFDGKAVTTEDFVDVMTAEEPRVDKEWFLRWYKTPGTPSVTITEEYSSGNLRLKFIQENKVSKMQKLGFTETYIPIKMSIYNSKGHKFILSSKAVDQPFLDKGILILKNKETHIEFNRISKDYICSYFEGFSAPVLYSVRNDKRNMATLIKFDQDNFNKYNAVKISAFQFAQGLNNDHIESLKYVFKDANMTDLMKSQILEPPTVNDFSEGKKTFNPNQILKIQKDYISKVGDEVGDIFLNYLKETSFKPFKYSLEAKGERALYICALEYLVVSSRYKTEAVRILKDIYNKSDNMTISFSALMLLQKYAYTQALDISNDFYETHHKEHLTLQKWISTFVSIPDFKEVEKRIKHVESLKGYLEKIPNFVRALWGSFCKNDAVFHDEKGRGYELLLNRVLKIDKINSQISSGLMKNFNITPRISGKNKKIIRNAVLGFNSEGAVLSKNLEETYLSIKGVL